MVAREIAEAERIGSAEAEAFRVLVGTPEGDPGPTLAGLAAELTGGETSREVALVQFGMPDDTLEIGGGIEAMATSLDALHHLETAVEASGVPVFARSRIADDPGLLLGQLADESVADTILVPEDPSYSPPGGTQAPAAPIARLCLNGATSTAGEVVVVLHGGGDDIHALDLGLRLPSSRGQALHVSRIARAPGVLQPRSAPFGRGGRGLPRRQRRPRDPRRPGDAGGRRDANSRRLERS